MSAEPVGRVGQWAGWPAPDPTKRVKLSATSRSGSCYDRPCNSPSWAYVAVGLAEEAGKLFHARSIRAQRQRVSVARCAARHPVLGMLQKWVLAPDP